MTRYLIILGRKSDLAFEELITVLKRTKPKAKLRIERIDQALILESQSKLEANRIIKTLGGTVKIVRLGKAADRKEFIDRLVTVLINESLGKSKLVFAVSTIGSRDPQQRFLIPKTIKLRLTEAGISSRYLLPSESDELTSAQVELSEAIELYVVWRDDVVEIGKSVALQDFKGFSKRDFGRPFADPKGGMLPPKVARMMLNLAFTFKPETKHWILDPFCGTGTIGMEGLMLGASVICSDISQKKVAGTRTNLRWLVREEEVRGEWRVIKEDATQIARRLKQKVDAIVTEPFLGAPNVTPQKLAAVVKGLNKLYLGALKQWKLCLRPNARVVMAIPEFTIGSLVKRANFAIDTCENLGYTLVAGPLEYERAGAMVKRLIYILKSI